MFNYVYLYIVFFFSFGHIYSQDFLERALNKGPFDFSYSEYHLKDTLRKELYFPSHCDMYREFMVHVWFPIQKNNAPLIIFSHGLGGCYNGMSYAWLCENLASYGYLVVSISHTYACKKITFPDGKTTDYFFPIPSVHLQQGDCFNKEIETWVLDIQHVIDECQRYNNDKNCALYHKIDLSTIVVMGHSFGGSAAMQVCRRDARVKAIINLDGPLYGAQALYPFFKPVLCIIADFGNYDLTVLSALSEAVVKALLWSWHMKGTVLPLINIFFETMMKDVCLITIENVVHEMFSDMAYSLDCAVQPLVINPILVHACIVSYIHAFLNYYVKNYPVFLSKELLYLSGVRIEKK